MLTQKIRSEKKYAAIEIAAGLDALETNVWELGRVNFLCEFNPYEWENWQWWTVGQKVKSIDEAYQDIYNELGRLRDIPEDTKIPMWIIQEECAEADRRCNDFSVFEFNTWRIDSPEPQFACYLHAYMAAQRTLDDESRWNVWEDNHYAVRDHYMDFLKANDDFLAMAHWRIELTWAGECL
jgi:hypothetical protein